MINPMQLNNKTIMITGASSGIGRETAKIVSSLGASVILVARSEDKLQSLIKELEGENHKYYCFDLKEITDIEMLIKKIVQENGSLDGFVHSAGVGSTRPLHMLKPDKLNEVMNVNFNSFIEIERCLSKKNNLNDGASIVGVSSVAGQQGNQSKTAYCASKAAMDAAVRCIAKELSSRTIRANTVAPGLAKTELFQQFINNSGSESEDAKNVMKRQYLGIVQPNNVGNTIAFLLSDASMFVTGSTIAIDSGRLTS